ncbi:MAG TPA: glycosyltransferase [Chitinophagaceae bacterium]|nr:glycosyltransferase [Chitinophagaceae bacterium]HPH31341.1 glycosyltransferase [Chitinophagaceae bacterium]HPN59192.1 glycosyltransferase [Chitinophagaceae bacterium]
MKVLFIQKMNGISGSELYMLQILPELKRRGYEVEMLIIFPSYGDKNKRYIGYLAEHGIPTHEIYNHGALSPFLFYKFYKLLKKNKYDLVQSNLVHADFLAAMTKFFLFRRMKMLSVKHGYHPAYQVKYGFDFTHLKSDPYYWVERFASNVANFNITISNGLYKVFTDGGIVKKSKIRNIYYGLTLTEPVEQKTVEKMPEGPFALIVGRLVGFKCHNLLIEAWKKVHAEIPELKLCIAGNGDLYEVLDKQIKEAGLEQTVLLLGHVPNPHPLMQASVFTLVTSAWEGFGLILLESWLHKKAIVAFDAPAMNEVIDHGKNGLLARAGNTAELAKQIIYLYQQPGLARQFGEEGFQKLHSYYTLARMTAETEEVYQQIVNS